MAAHTLSLSAQWGIYLWTEGRSREQIGGFPRSGPKCGQRGVNGHSEERTRKCGTGRHLFVLFENISLFESLDMSNRLLHDRPLNTPVVDHLFSDWEIELTTATHANETPVTGLELVTAWSRAECQIWRSHWAVLSSALRL